MRWKPVAIVTVVLAVLVVGGWGYYRSTPQYALQQVARAIQDHDKLAFERRVDVDAVVDGAVDDLIESAMAELGQDESEMGALGAAFGSAMLEGMRPALKAMARSAIDERIFSDSATSDSAAEDGPDLKNMTRGASLGSDAFQGLGEVWQEGDVAIVDLRFHEEILDTTLVLALRMERQESDWRVVALENLDAYISTLDSLQEKKLAEENAEVAAKLAAMAEVGEVQRSMRSSGWLDQIIVLQTDLRNLTDDTIVSATALLRDAAGTIPRDEVVLRISGVIAPGETGTLWARVNYNPFIESHERIANRDLSADLFSVSVGPLLSATSTIKYDSWERFVAIRQAQMNKR